MNAVEIEEAVSALAERPFDAAEFPFAFLEAFGNKETTIKRLRTGASNTMSDLGRRASDQQHPYRRRCPRRGHRDAGRAEGKPGNSQGQGASSSWRPTGTRSRPRTWQSGETVACDYAAFPDHFGFFLPLAGITTVRQLRESRFDIRATSRLNRLYVELLKDNPDWDAAERRPDMNHFMARLIFCFFAEDTDIFHGAIRSPAPSSR